MTQPVSPPDSLIATIRQTLESRGFTQTKREGETEVWVRPFDKPLRPIAATISPNEDGYWVILSDGGLNGPIFNFKRVRMHLLSDLRDTLGPRTVRVQ